MADAPAQTPPPPVKPPGKKGEGGFDYVKRVLSASDALIAALAAAGAFAVANLGLDRLGKGDYGDGRLFAALVGLLLFAAGVVAAVGALYAGVRGSRVSHAWLLTDDGKHIRTRLEKTPYMLGGHATVEELSTEIKRLVDLQTSDPIAFLQSPLLLPERLRLRILLDARTSMLDQAVAERTQRPWLTIVMGVGAIAAAIGAGIFAFATNQAQQVEAETQRALERTEAIEDLDRARTEALEDRDAARIVSGDLLPKSSTLVRIVIPEGADLDAITSELSADPGDPCDIAALTGTLVEIATPPEAPHTRVMRVVTPTTRACKAGDLWLEPAWVIPAPVAPSTPPTTAGSGD